MAQQWPTTPTVNAVVNFVFFSLCPSLFKSETCIRYTDGRTRPVMLTIMTIEW